MDLKELGDNLGLEVDEFTELVELFLTSAASDIDRLQKAYTDNNSNLAAEAAHSLKGSAGNLGFSEFSDIAKNIENNARKNILERADETLTALNEHLSIVSDSLQNTTN